ncbi:MAG TPA: serine hydrolase domain-containing protein [Thermomicrobiales bacterium]|nr:serine hydrolase domain-containing protein [Thermomicrobiales bacterium]
MASATTQRRRGRRAGADGDATFQGLCEFVQAEMERLHVPGVAVGVVHDGKEYTAGFGVTSVENPLPVTADTLFQIGSTTKTVTGTAAMRLVERGKLDLDAPLRTYLPKLRLKDEAAAARVTLRHLFNHTGGWLGDYFDDTGMGEDALRRIVTRMAKLPQLTPLGEVWSYNNAGYYLAGRVLEVVTGQPYETVVQELVFDPLGMGMSFFFPGDVLVHRFAVGHTVQDDEVKIATPWPLPRAAHAAGGVTSTVKDQLTYARFHLGDGAAPDGARLLSPESMQEMQTPRVDAGSQAGMLGVTWWVKDLDGVRVVRHGGTTNGQLSAFVLAPSRGFALTVLTNANRGGELHGNAVEWALREYLGVADPAPEPLALSAAQLAPYAGRYRAAMTEIELTVRDDELVLQVSPKGGFPKRDTPPGPPPPPTRLGVCADDRVVALDPPYKGARGEFLRDDAGAITWLRFGGRIARRQ